MRPRIGVTFGSAVPIRRFELYMQAIEQAGGQPLKLEALAAAADLEGLLLPGGADVDPLRYGEPPDPRLNAVDGWRDELELRQVEAMVRARKPVLGICRGLQVLNVALGGKLIQHVDGHEGGISHPVEVEPASAFGRAAGTTKLVVNSSHHQVAGDVASDLSVTARSPDGIVEGLESADGLLVAVQCHPERLASEPWAQALFRAFLEQAAR